MILRPLLALALCGAFAMPARAQLSGSLSPSDSTLVDRVLAVVGDSVILLSEVMQEREIALSQGIEVAEEEILENLIDLQVVLQAAARDSTMIPPDAEVNRRVDSQVENARAQYASESAFQEALSRQGLTVASYRDQLRTRFRAELTRQIFLQRYSQSAAPEVVSEAEMREYFDQYRDPSQLRPELLTVRQVLIRTTPSEAEWTRALQLADSLHALLLRGADFETLATAHSEDPGSAAQGGDLGWLQRGGTALEFDQTAFSLPDGGLSAPVRTEFGYHIIFVERSRPGEKRVRHILLRPALEQSDLDRTRALGDDVAARIRAGESALTLAQTHGDATFPREMTIARGDETQLPPVFIQSLAGASTGDIVGPFQTDQLEPPHTHFVVLQVTEVRAAGEFTFEDVREVIRQRMIQEKREDRMYRELRDRTYVEIRH